jgi:hypothetical protein
VVVDAVEPTPELATASAVELPPTQYLVKHILLKNMRKEPVAFNPTAGTPPTEAEEERSVLT